MYKIYQHLLEKSDPQNDLVVRLTAARSLKYAINDWDFNIEGFLPFADDIFEKLLALMDEVEVTETKMAILNVIGKMVNRLDEKVEPFAERVVEIIPPLWEATGEEHIFKQAILVVLTKVVNAMREKSVKFHHMVLPLIKFGVESGTVSYPQLHNFAKIDTTDLSAVRVCKYTSLRKVWNYGMPLSKIRPLPLPTLSSNSYPISSPWLKWAPRPSAKSSRSQNPTLFSPHGK